MNERMQASKSAEISWPPYGLMPEDWEAGGEKGPLPAGFDAPAWDAFVQQVLEQLAAVLWPVHDGAGWVGDAQAIMEVLSRADLALMASTLQPLFGGVVPSGASHRELFRDEDDLRPGRKNFDTLSHYLRKVPPELLSAVVDAAGAGIAALGPRPLTFKRRLQRPRPYQVSLLLPGIQFGHTQAKSACSPSMMSGHCLQGLIAATAAYVRHQTAIDSLAGARQALAQFGVDFGDRRVFAGVHYPSDNLASWFIALRLAPTLFGSKASIARAFMVDAIRASAVFRALSHQASQVAEPFEGLMEWIGSQMA